MEEFKQTDVLPVIVPGCAGTVETPTASVCAGEEPQLLSAVIVMFPARLPTVALMELVADVPDQPPGNVHVYAVAPATETTEYDCELAEQGDTAPEIFPGCKGKLFPFGVMVSDDTPPEPHALLADTFTCPLPLPISTLIEVVVDEPL